MLRKLIITEDGSHTIRVDDLDEHYHSTFGALAESKHVFIEAGLHKKLEEKPDTLSILEIGFGTGMNALLTMLDHRLTGVDVNYVGLEAYPIDRALWEALNYPDLLDDVRAHELFNRLHECEWGKQIEFIKGFKLKKKNERLEEFRSTNEAFDLIYFDAFGPDVQSELWTPEIFLKIAGLTLAGGILVTYSCKGSVKRALKAAGFEIEKIPGPKGKREMIRGTRY